MRIYISGKMTGLDKKEYMGKFNAAEKRLRGEGHEVINPVTVDAYGLDYEKSMAIDLILLESCDGIYMLDNWKESKGARIERNHAMSMGIIILYENQPVFQKFTDSIRSVTEKITEVAGI